MQFEFICQRALELGAKEVLTRAQLKDVMGGGGGSSSCSVTCTNGDVKTENCGDGVSCQTSGAQINAVQVSG